MSSRAFRDGGQVSAKPISLGLEFTVLGFGFGILGLEFRVQGLGLWV